MTALLRALRHRLRFALLGRALSIALTENDTAREDLDRAIRETLQR